MSIEVTVTTACTVMVEQWMPDKNHRDRFDPAHWEEIHRRDLAAGEGFVWETGPGFR